MTLFWLIPKRYTILEDFFLLDSLRYHDVMKILKSDWSNLKILRSGWYSKVTSSCVSFTMSWWYRGRYHSDIVTISECSLGQHDVVSVSSYVLVIQQSPALKIHRPNLKRNLLDLIWIVEWEDLFFVIFVEVCFPFHSWWCNFNGAIFKPFSTVLFQC